MSRSYKRSKTNSNLGYLIPIILFMCLTPFIFYLKVVKFDMSIYEWHSDTTIFPDFFTYYKSIFIIALTFVALFILLYKLATSKYFKFDKKLYYIPLIVYFTFMVFSWIFSDYSHTAAYGYLERFEGGLILTCYLFMFLYITQVIETEGQVRRIIKYFVMATLVMNILGFLQYIHLDIFRVEAIRKLFIPSQFHSGQVDFKLDIGTVYMTLYHPNYVGLYLSLIFPICFTFFICEKKWKNKIFWGFLTLLTLINLQGSGSRGGVIGIAVALVIGVIFLRKQIFKYWKVLVPSFLILIVLFLGFDVKNDWYFSKKLVNTIKQVAEEPVDYDLEEIITDGNKLHITYKDQPLTVTYDDYNNPVNTITYMDENNNTLDINSINEQDMTFSDPKYQVYTFKYGLYKDKPHLQFIMADKSTWLFAFTEEGFRYVNPFGKQVVLEDVPQIGFEGKERTGSARGYIWAKSLPLLKDSLFIGYGPDSFVYVFPQNDYVGKYNAYRTANMVVDKPHNIYLQNAINTGVISLIAMLVFWGMYIISSIKLYFKNDLNDYISILGVALFLSICGYLGAGIFNDANVSISPIYWGIIALGFVVNSLNKKKLKG